MKSPSISQLMEPYQMFIEYLRDAQSAQNDVDNFDLDEKDKASLNKFNELAEEADKQAFALIGLVVSLHKEIASVMIR